MFGYILVYFEVIVKFFVMCSEVPSYDVIANCAEQGRWFIYIIPLTSVHIIFALFVRVGWNGTYLMGAFSRQTLGGTVITNIILWGDKADMVQERVECVGLLLFGDAHFMFK